MPASAKIDRSELLLTTRRQALLTVHALLERVWVVDVNTQIAGFGWVRSAVDEALGPHFQAPELEAVRRAAKDLAWAPQVGPDRAEAVRRTLDCLQALIDVVQD